MSKPILACAALAAILVSTGAFAQRGPQEPLTRDQYIALQKQRFASLDANGDGVVTKEEAVAQMAARMGNTPPPQMVDRLFAMMDKDGDGKATTAEVEAAAAARFTELDTNKDGTLTPEEQRAGRQGMRGQ